MLTDTEATDWGGWERVEYLVSVLAREQDRYHAPHGQPQHQHQHAPPPPSRYGDPGPSSAGGGSGAGGSSVAMGKAPERRTGNERMSITSII